MMFELDTFRKNCVEGSRRSSNFSESDLSVGGIPDGNATGQLGLIGSLCQ